MNYDKSIWDGYLIYQTPDLVRHVTKLHTNNLVARKQLDPKLPTPSKSFSTLPLQCEPNQHLTSPPSQSHAQAVPELLQRALSDLYLGWLS
jgi:hypothetical protein